MNLHWHIIVKYLSLLLGSFLVLYILPVWTNVEWHIHYYNIMLDVLTALKSSLLCLFILRITHQPWTHWSFYHICEMSEVAQLCPTLCDHMGCSPPGSSVHGIFQARVLEWVAISFSRGSSQPRDWTQVSCIVSETLYHLSHQGSP